MSQAEFSSKSSMALHSAVVHWVCRGKITFGTVESPHFRSLMKIANPRYVKKVYIVDMIVGGVDWLIVLCVCGQDVVSA